MPTDRYRGFIALGNEALAYSLDEKTPPDVKESFSIGPVDTPDDAYHRAAAPANFFAPNMWPEGLPEFRSTWTTYYRRMEELAGTLMRIFAMALDMLILGTLTGLGLWLVGAPFPFPLAVLSGVSVFVPYIGPILVTIPGLLLALSVSPQHALWAGIVYLVVWQIEGNISLPLLQRRTVHMPPAISLMAIVAFGLLFGIWGVLLATPLAVVTMTIVRMAYVEDFLEGR